MQGLFAVFQFGKKTIPDAAECCALGLGQIKALAPFFYQRRYIFRFEDFHALNIIFPNGKNNG